MDVLHASVELKSKLLRCDVVVVLDIKAFVEHQYVTSTVIVLLVFAVTSGVLVVVTNDVLLAHRVILPHTRIDPYNRLPLFRLITIAYQVGLYVRLRHILVRCHHVVRRWLDILPERRSLVVEISQLSLLLLSQ